LSSSSFGDDGSRQIKPVQSRGSRRTGSGHGGGRDLYGHYVLHSLATFEEAPPALGDMLARRRASVDRGLPYLVAEVGGVVAGFAYAGLYRSRPAYRFAIEDSV
jgi:hypothetical protein